LIVSAIGQGVDFTGLEEFDNGKGAISTDRNYQIVVSREFSQVAT